MTTASQELLQRPETEDVPYPAIEAIYRDALLCEASAITDYATTVGPEVSAALDLIHSSRGPLIVAGIGKSGHIARKIASTFRSIGKPAIFLHAAEASHGDLGLVHPDSVVLILSNSGETSELSDLIHYCDAHNIPTIALTSAADSTLARSATVALVYGPTKEVCPNGLAPTTSTTLSLAIGDALAVGVTRLLGTLPEDFRRYHPGGKLGARLVRAADLMHRGDALPTVTPDAPMAEVVIEMSAKALGVAIIVDGGVAKGIVTDGDMRRKIDTLWQSTASQIGTSRPIAIGADTLATEAVEVMTLHGITSCLIEDEDGQLVGLLHIHDCLRTGLAA